MFGVMWVDYFNMRFCADYGLFAVGCGLWVLVSVPVSRCYLLLFFFFLHFVGIQALLRNHTGLIKLKLFKSPHDTIPCRCMHPQALT